MVTECNFCEIEVKLSMKLHKILTAAVVCICLLLSLAGCAEEPVETTPPTTASTSAPTEAPVDPMDLYTAAVETIFGANNLVLDFGYTQNRVVGGETYTESRSGTAFYGGRNGDDMEALIAESFTCGSYSTQYFESYIDGAGWCRVNNCNFRCDMTVEEFTAGQLPAVLLDSSLYSTMTAEQATDGTVLYFDGATALESWLPDGDDAELITAHGKLVLDASGHIIAGSYHAEYTRLTTSYSLDAVVENITTLESLDFSDQQPVYPQDCAVISDLDVPRYLLRAVGDVYTAKNMSVNYYDTMYSQAFGQIRTQSSSYHTYGSDESFMAALSNQVSVTDYTGAVVSNAQTAIYRDGQYSYSYNGGEPTVDSAVTAEQVRINWEDSILSALMKPDYLAGAEITDTGDFLCIQFTGNEAFAEVLCGNIYSLFGMDLDTFAESYATEFAKGYLTINKYTKLPTAMGMSLSRSHVISQVSYQLTYQLDQALELSSESAYKNITGEAPEETGTDSASPLFYKVTGGEGQVMWLLGTIHVGDARTANLPQQILDAFAAADALAIECDNDRFAQELETNSALQSQISDAYYYSDGTDVSSHIAKETYDRLLPLMMASGTNNINGPYLRTILWQNQLETLFLAQSYSLSGEKGMESRLLQWAAEQEKPVYEIESVLAQVQMLTGLSEQLQEMLLTQTIELGVAGTYEEVSQLYELWCQGDEAALTEALATDTADLSDEEAALTAEYQKAVITDRNQGMLQVATGYLESGETVFYAVGLGHLLGEDGLVELLRAAGYAVELVSYE